MSTKQHRPENGRADRSRHSEHLRRELLQGHLDEQRAVHIRPDSDVKQRHVFTSRAIRTRLANVHVQVCGGDGQDGEH